MSGSLTEIEVQASDLAWFALMVKTRYERLIGTSLEQKGYEVLVPTYQLKRLRGDRYRSCDAVLFPSYVFCRFSEQKRLPILTTPGVTHIVGTSRGLERVREDEITALKTVMKSKVQCQPWPWVRPGQLVEITNGPLKGITGSIVNVSNGSRLILNVTGLHRSVAVRIELDSISPVTQSYRAVCG